jgi:hypothetical protein
MSTYRVRRNVTTRLDQPGSVTALIGSALLSRRSMQERRNG